MRIIFPLDFSYTFFFTIFMILSVYLRSNRDQIGPLAYKKNSESFTLVKFRENFIEKIYFKKFTAHALFIYKIYSIIHFYLACKSIVVIMLLHFLIEVPFIFTNFLILQLLFIHAIITLVTYKYFLRRRIALNRQMLKEINAQERTNTYFKTLQNQWMTN